MATFVPMLIGVFGVFVPQFGDGWLHLLPVAGQQWQLERWMSGAALPVAPAVLLCLFTLLATAAALHFGARLLECDDIVYSG